MWILQYFSRCSCVTGKLFACSMQTIQFESRPWAGWGKLATAVPIFRTRCDAKAPTLGSYKENHVIFCKKGGVKSSGTARSWRCSPWFVLLHCPRACLVAVCCCSPSLVGSCVLEERCWSLGHAAPGLLGPPGAPTGSLPLRRAWPWPGPTSPSGLQQPCCHSVFLGTLSE